MNVGMWTSYFGDLSPEEMVREFAEKDWLHLELSNEHAAKLLERGAPSAVGGAFRSHARDQGVSFPQGHLWLACDIAASDQTEVLDQLKSWLDLFLAVGIRAGVLHPGGNQLRKQGRDKAAILAAQVRALNVLSNHLKDTDLTLCLENMARHATKAEELLDILEAAGSASLGICLDTGHLNMAGGDPVAFIRKSAPALKALHIQDNEGASDQHMMPYGRGTVPWDRVLAALKEARYEGLFNLEIPGENRCPLAVRRAKLDYLKTLVQLMLEDPAGG